MNTKIINRLARAIALQKELQTKGNTPKAARLANKVFGVTNKQPCWTMGNLVGVGYPCWNWASLYYKTALITETWK